MTDIHSWLEVFMGRLEERFHGRIWFAGLQGSYARGEAKETSDIDVVVIFNTFSMEDSDLLQFCYDTIPITGNILSFRVWFLLTKREYYPLKLPGLMSCRGYCSRGQDG